MDNAFNPKFNESDKTYSNIVIFYREIIFFIKQTLERVFNLIVKQDASQSTQFNNTSSNFFKNQQQDSTDVHLTNTLPKNSPYPI